MPDRDARRLTYRQFANQIASGVWNRIVINDDSRVRFRVSGTTPYQLATGPNVESVFAYVEADTKNTYDLRRDLDGDLVSSEIWFISFAASAAYFGYEVTDPHGLYNVDVE